MSEEILKNSGISPEGKPYRVMIVDDSAFIIKQLTRIITSAGYEIAAEALNGKEAVAHYEKSGSNIDIITMDITMPEMNGIEAVDAIRKIDSEAKIVMVSALGHEALVKQAILRGAKHFIVKPFQREQVLKVLKSVLSK